ncbi:MAG: endonuclease/exonuclease/phosphatase family protein [Bacteroidaceae bacterium]|nr:endonuclease/exonuclease/phosphatase family protein [Bacteroidaceae bacterium]
MKRQKKKMKWYTKLWAYPLLLINIFVCGVFILCAFSQQIPAEKLPIISLAGMAFPIALGAVVAFLVFWLLFYKRLCWLSLITLLVCSTQIYSMVPINISDIRAPRGAMKVLSYNVLSVGVDEKDPILQYLAKSKADIICLQEANAAHLKKYDQNAEWMKDYPYRTYRMPHGGTREARDICCISKYPILSLKNVRFPNSGNCYSEYTLDVEGDTITLFNCHLQSFALNEEDKNLYEEIISHPKESLPTSGTKELLKKLREANAKRSVQADSLAKHIEQALGNGPTPRTVIVCGDFNDTPISYSHYRVTRLLKDAHTLSGNGFGFSYNRNKMFFRIDHILASHNLKPYRCKVDRSIKESDHYPIYSYFVYRKP